MLPVVDSPHFRVDQEVHEDGGQGQASSHRFPRQEGIPVVPTSQTSPPSVPSTSAVFLNPGETILTAEQTKWFRQLFQSFPPHIQNQITAPYPQKIASSDRDCPVCKRHYTTVKALRRHFLKHSPGPLLHTCATCGRGFSLKKHLVAHKVTHGAPSHVCQTCSRGYFSASSLSRHMRGTHPEGGQPSQFTCVFCLSKLKTRDGLDSHVRVCRKNPAYKGPFPCVSPGCNRVYIHRKDLLRHLRSSHPHLSS